MSVFLDSSALIAYYSMKDTHHGDAVKLLRGAFNLEFGSVYTSDYILDESVTVTCVRTKSKEIAVGLGERLLQGDINLLKVTEDIVEKTWELYKTIKNPSFTDCTSIILMWENGIENIITFDEGFARIEGIEMKRIIPVKE